MDVRCDRCQTEFELEDHLVRAEGTPVKCGACGHVFEVRPAPRTEGQWLLRPVMGPAFQLASLTELQQGIVLGKFTLDDSLSRTGEGWKKLRDLPEFTAFFESAASGAGKSVPNPRRSELHGSGALPSAAGLPERTPPTKVPPPEGRVAPSYSRARTQLDGGMLLVEADTPKPDAKVDDDSGVVRSPPPAAREIEFPASSEEVTAQAVVGLQVRAAGGDSGTHSAQPEPPEQVTPKRATPWLLVGAALLLLGFGLGALAFHRRSQPATAPRPQITAPGPTATAVENTPSGLDAPEVSAARRRSTPTQPQSAEGADVLVRLGNRALVARDTAAAERHFRDALAIAADPRASSGLGHVALSRGDLASAERYFQSAAARGLADGTIGLAETFRRSGRVPQARATLEAFLRAHPNAEETGVIRSQLTRLR